MADENSGSAQLGALPAGGLGKPRAPPSERAPPAPFRRRRQACGPRLAAEFAGGGEMPPPGSPRRSALSQQGLPEGPGYRCAPERLGRERPQRAVGVDTETARSYSKVAQGFFLGVRMRGRGEPRAEAGRVSARRRPGPRSVAAREPFCLPAPLVDCAVWFLDTSHHLHGVSH